MSYELDMDHDSESMSEEQSNIVKEVLRAL